MKKLYILFLLLIAACCTNVWGQSGEWGYVLDLNPVNTNNRHAKSSGSGTYISIYPYDSNGNEGGRIFFTESFRQERGEWKRFIVPVQINGINVKVPKIKISHRVDWEGGGSNTRDNDLALFPDGYSQLEYNYFRVCNGTQSANCKFTQDLFNQMQGHVDVYTFPKNIRIVLQSSENQGISAENKAKTEAPAGYGSSVYKWVYRTSPTGTWQPIANTSLNGNRILEASLQDIYGSGFMNDGVVDFSSNTFIALEYDVYKSSSNVKDKEYSNIITLSNKLTAPKIVSATGGKTVCPGESNGKITVVVDRPLIAGKEIIEFFAWTSDGIKGNKRDYTRINDVTYEITGLIAGEYTVETGSRYGAGEVSTNITDADHKRTGVKVTEPEPVSYLVNETDKKHISCKGGNDGSFKVTAGGGTGPYTLWREADGTSGFSPVADNLLEVSGLKAGTYRYYVTDLNHCELEDPQYGGILYKTVTLMEPAQSLAVSFLPDKTEMPTGNGRSDGYITAKISGGTPPYTVVWREKTSNSVLSTVDNGIADESKLYNIPSGTYTVTVTDSKGCTISTPAEFTLDEPDALNVTVNQQGQILCFGDASANLTVFISGGAGGPYVYVWSKKINGIYTQISTNSYLNNQPAGDYKVRVSDGSTPPNEKEVEYSIQEPSELTVSATKIDVSCKNAATGSVTLAVTGGVAPYKIYYKESNASSYANSTATSSVYSITGLKAGTYDYYVTDANNCRANTGTGINGQVTVTEPAVELKIISSEIKNISGLGRSDGSITVKVDGGVPYPAGNTYQITWRKDGGAVIPSDAGTDGNGKFTSTVKDLDRGLYHLEIQDNNTVPCTINADFNLTEPPPLSVSLAETNRIDCFGGYTARITASATGGVPRLSGLPYTYRWYRVEAGNDILIENESNSTLNDTGAGAYKVKIEDGSTPPNTAESVIAVSQPPALETSVARIKNISCFEGSDGHIRISVTGGTGNYKLYYKLNGTDTDYRETDGGSQAHTFLLNNLPAGVYSVYIQDENSCYAAINGADMAEIVLSQPDKELSIATDTVYDPTANGLSNGEIHIRPDGGTPEYTVIWRDSRGNELTAQHSIVDGVFSSSLTGLGEGKYRVEVRDANYSKADQSNNTACIVIKEYELIQPEVFTLDLEETHYVSCYQMSDGEITAHAQGGVRNKEGNRSPYKYIWYREEAGNFVVMPGRNDSILTGIPDGTYRLEVEDYARIPNRISAVYRIVQPEALTATTEDIRVVCGETATVSVAVSGGTMPYAYRWNTGDATPEVNEMTPGKYMVIVTDARGCEATAIARVISPSDLSISADINHPVCYGAANGSIITGVTGGTAPYTYLWSTGETTKDSKNIGAGVYTVVVTDKDGCSFSESFELKDPEPVKVDLGGDLTLCAGRSCLLAPRVEDPKTEFSWTGPGGFQSKDSQVELSKAGTYRLTITDSKGCRATDEIEVFLTDYSISSEMVVATEMLANDTIVLVNISSPDPERIEWLFSENDPVVIVETSFEMAKIIFRQSGEYAVGMRSYLKDCYQDVFKTLNVKEAGDSIGNNFGQTDILEFTVSPNPNDGNFKVKIELGRQSTVRLRLFSLTQGNLTDDKTLRGQKLYEESYRLFLAPGVYVLLLETASGRRSQKIIIH